MKKSISLIMALLMVLMLGACTPKKPADQGSYSAVLYFANKEYVLTGNEELEKLIPEDRSIEVKENSFAKTLILELVEGPENQELVTLIPDTVKILDVSFEDTTANVNFSSEGLQGGSMQEAFTINQIVATLLELEEVDRVQFLVDGEKAESLMGHFDISKPFEQTI